MKTKIVIQDYEQVVQKRPPRGWSKKEKLTILREAEQAGVVQTCRKFDVSSATVPQRLSTTGKRFMMPMERPDLVKQNLHRIRNTKT